MLSRHETVIGGRHSMAIAVIGLLVCSALCVAVAPLFMPESYSIVLNAVSEAGAQRTEHAWVTHLGFLLFGFAVLLLAEETHHIWPEWARWAHRVFGGSVIMAAVFSDAPWFRITVDPVEDRIHSVAGGFVGVGFAVGVILLALWRGSIFTRTFDGLAAAAAVVVPTVMFFAGGVAGAAERVMFVIAYLWYGGEAIRAARVHSEHANRGRRGRDPTSPPLDPACSGETTSGARSPLLSRVLSDPPPGWFDVRTTASVAAGLLAASLTAMTAAPLFMPASYSVIERSVDESGAQGIAHAWIARLGFLLFGFAVLLLASQARRAWGRWGLLAHRASGVAMIAAGAFSHLPWETWIPADAFEDLLHGAAASAIAVAFTTGVLLVTLRPRPRWVHVLDAITIVAAVVIPMLMFGIESVAGLVQRILFLIGYLWYGMEAIRLRRRTVTPAGEFDTGAAIHSATRRSNPVGVATQQ